MKEQVALKTQGVDWGNCCSDFDSDCFTVLSPQICYDGFKGCIVELEQADGFCPMIDTYQRRAE